MSTAEFILAAVFWCCAAGVLYAYLGYPAVVYACSRLFGHAPRPPDATEHQLPRVALLIAAHNEADVIEERIANALASDYPTDRLQVVIASDGSDDGTAEICRRHEGRIRALIFSERRGKAATLNAAFATLSADIVVLSDANTDMDRSAIRNLVRWFSDPAVGAVCGRLVLTDPRTGRNSDSLYWRYETFLKQCESRLGGLLGANGAIYAIRRELFTPLPPGTMVDDFVIPLAARLRSGCRIVYDSDAIAREETPPGIGDEFRRRSRIGVGGAQALGMLWPLMNPAQGWTAFTLLSHKILRWICPLLLLGALFSSAALAAIPAYRLALAAQLAFYTLSGAAFILPPANRFFRLLRLLPMFTGMNLALLTGFIRAMRGKATGIWRRTDRARVVHHAGGGRLP